MRLASCRGAGPDEQLYKCWYSPFIVDRAVSETPREKRGQVPYRPRGREMGVCYGASNGTHNGWRDGFLALAQLRPDGWAGYVPRDEGQPAVVVTRPVTCNDQKLRLTADVLGGGSVKVTILDASGKTLDGVKTLAASETHAAVADVGQLRGQSVRVRFEIERASLYAFSFGP